MKVSSLATFAAAVVALGASIAACGTTNNNAVTQSSALGESCAQTADCKSGLVCVDQTCEMGAVTSPDGGSSGGTDGGGSSSGSSSGGSSSGASSGGSSGGTVVPEAAPPHLGARGDACTSTGDCGPGLNCIPIPNTGFGSSAGGICDVTSYNLDGGSTGKSCTGECNTAADCCELPLNVTIGGIVYHDCNDLQSQVIGGATCSSLSAGDVTNVGLGCFYYATYCNGCAAAAWSCDSTTHQCQYGGACMASGISVQGCPAKSRDGLHSLVTTCNSNKCQPATVASGCSLDSDCAGQPYIAFDGTVASDAVCRAATASGNNNCTCQGHACYLTCSTDLDCATGYKCDTGATKLCVPTGACATNAQCATQSGDVRETCSSGACILPCATDSDCSSAGDTSALGFGSFRGTVCVAGACQALGCLNDADCNVTGGSNPVHLLCESTATAAAPTYASAVTGH